MSPGPGTRRRLAGHADPLGLVVAAAALAVFLLHGFQSPLSRDLAVYAYGGQQTLEGVAPYVSIMNRAGPLAHLVPAFGAWVDGAIGIDDLLGMRLVMMVLSIGCVSAIYLLGRDLFRSRLVGLVTAGTLLTFAGFVEQATGGPREKTTMMLFLILALWCVVRRNWGLAGACIALSTLAWQPVFFPATAAVLVGVAALRGREILRALLAFAIGGAIPSVICLVGFWMAGALDDLREGFVLINAEYTTQPGLLTFLDAFGLEVLLDGFGWSLYVIIAGLVLVVVAAAARIPRAFRGREPVDMGLVAIGASTCLGLVWSLRAFNGWPDAVVLLPMAAVGIGAAAGALVTLPGPRRIATPLLVTLTAVALIAAGVSSYDGRKDGLVLERRAVKAVLGTAPEGATIMSIGAPQPLVLSHLTNPAQYQMFGAGLAEYVDDTYPGGLAGFVDFIEQERPTFLTFDDPAAYGWLAELRDRDYTRVGRTSGFVWYVRDDVGEDTIEQLRRTTQRLREAARQGSERGL